ncbi:MAG: hypothetical protein R2713_05825 [Ilumatobacteraceae bacterium]
MSVAVHHVATRADRRFARARADASTPNAIFRQEDRAIGSLLLAEATRNLPTQTVRVTTPLTETSGRCSPQPIVVRCCERASGSCTPRRSCCRTPTWASSA